VKVESEKTVYLQQWIILTLAFLLVTLEDKRQSINRSSKWWVKITHNLEFCTYLNDHSRMENIQGDLKALEDPKVYHP
jgi:hypothetical protein